MAIKRKDILCSAFARPGPSNLHAAPSRHLHRSLHSHTRQALQFLTMAPPLVQEGVQTQRNRKWDPSVLLVQSPLET